MVGVVGSNPIAPTKIPFYSIFTIYLSDVWICFGYILDIKGRLCLPSVEANLSIRCSGKSRFPCIDAEHACKASTSRWRRFLTRTCCLTAPWTVATGPAFVIELVSDLIYSSTRNRRIPAQFESLFRWKTKPAIFRLRSPRAPRHKYICAVFPPV